MGDAIDAAIDRVAEAENAEARIVQNVVIASTSTDEHQRVVSINVPADLTDAEMLEFAAWFIGPFANALRAKRTTSRLVVPRGVVIK
jgi:hypothetical protein